MKRKYRQEVNEALKTSGIDSSETLTEKDISFLPEPVQKYIRITGSPGKPKIRSVWIRATGKIRSTPGSGWMEFESEQVNLFEPPFRAFYIKAKKSGIPALGLHLYKNATASMVIKLAGLFKIVDVRGIEMNQSETVTIFNDMCFMAPATLTDRNITWECGDNHHVKARYTNSGITIGAELEFDDEGKLVNFISGDRYELSGGKTFKKYPWLTPVREYGHFNGYYLPAKADVIYRHPEGDFCYLEFELKDIKYNI